MSIITSLDLRSCYFVTSFPPFAYRLMYKVAVSYDMPFSHKSSAVMTHVVLRLFLSEIKNYKV